MRVGVFLLVVQQLEASHLGTQSNGSCSLSKHFLKAADKILDIIIVLSLQNWKTGCTVN